MATVLDESLETVLSEFGYDIDMIKKFLVECNCVITGDAVIKAKLMKSPNPPDLSEFKIRDLHIWIQTYGEENTLNDKNIKNMVNFERICNEYGFIYKNYYSAVHNMFNYDNYYSNIYYIAPRYMKNTRLYYFSKIENLTPSRNEDFEPNIVKNRIHLVVVDAFYYEIEKRLNIYREIDITQITEQDNIYPSQINNNFSEIECILNVLNKSFINEYKNYAYSGYIHNKIDIKLRNNKIITNISLYSDTQLHFKEYYILIYYIAKFYGKMFFKIFPGDLKSYGNIYKSIKYLYEFLYEKNLIYYLICAWNKEANKIKLSNIKFIFINENFKFTSIIQDCTGTGYRNLNNFIEFIDSINNYDCTEMLNYIRTRNIPEIPDFTEQEQIVVNTRDREPINYFRDLPLFNVVESRQPIDGEEFIPQNVIDDSIRDQERLEMQTQDDFKNINDMLPNIPNMDEPNYNEYMKDLYRKYLNFFGIELKVPLRIGLRQQINKYKDALLESPICNQGFDAVSMTDFSDKRLDKVNEYLYEEYLKESTDLTDLEKEEIKNEIYKNKIIGIYDVINNKMYCIVLNDEINVLNKRKLRGIITNSREECERLKYIQPSMYFLNFSIINRTYYARNNLNYLPFLSKNPIHSVYLLLDTTLKWFDTNPNVVSAHHNDETGDKLHLIVPLDLFDYE